jgi:oligopeptide/dipeptide ABC transporter ATP-binding protein
MTTIANTDPLLTVRNLKVHFKTGRGRETIKAVDGVDFDVVPGETFGVIGESGSGKSTIGWVIACLLQPSAGEVRHLNTDLSKVSRRELRLKRRDFQIIFQDPNAALDPRMSILQSVREPLDVIGVGPRAETIARELLDRMGLGAYYLDRYPHELSGGQKQRVNIARALAVRPKLIVCDEVVSALDVSIKSDILNLFVELQAEYGLTYVFITHDLGVVAHISDRVAVMYLGRFMELGPTDEVTGKQYHPYTRALMSAEPMPLPREMRGNERRIVLRGEIPNPISPPSGCRFRTRCWKAVSRCAEQVPQWRLIGPGHWVACHFPGEEYEPAASDSV